MTRSRTGRKPATAHPQFTALLDRLIAEATVDAHDDSEQVTGLFYSIEEHLEVPFTTVVLGVEVTVHKVDLASDNTIVAVCARGRHRQRLPILDLPLPDPPPVGVEWIHAYRRWCRGR